MAHSTTPFLMFEGKAREAMSFYVSLFKRSEILLDEAWKVGDLGRPGLIKRGEFSLNGQRFICFDSPVHHDFQFTPSISLFVECESESELDTVFQQLSEGGQILMPLGNYGFSTKFGWLNDRFGVSWQLNLT
ncbi:VOC family protein [Schlesneria paludicola]|uniref:VOC family protein n=1 Tax=Schlesneria paludicola TaxID=360056 RepID=UPI00029A6BC2|nr:VOC family protein [Schlesneria paludicola]